MTRQQLEDEYSRLLCLLSEPKPDTHAIEDAFRRITVAALQWMDYAEGLVRTHDRFRREYDYLLATQEHLWGELEKAREGNAILLRALRHAERVRVPMERDECVRLCREVG